MVTGNTQAQARGQIAGFVIAMTVIISGAALIALGHETEGFRMVVGAAATLAGVFVFGRWRQEKERREKLAALPALQSGPPPGRRE